MNWVYYYYNPSEAAACIFVVLFGLSTLMHFYQLVRTRTWFMIPFLIGGILETIGYVGRLLSGIQARDFTEGPYVIQSTLILIAPAFLAASIYMTLGRIILMIDAEKLAVIKFKWLTAIFVCGDVLSFLMQASGTYYLAILLLVTGLMVSSSSISLGENVIVGGLIVQIIFFGIFTITAIVFQARIAKRPTGRSMQLESIWHHHLMALYICSAFILVRSVIRVAEYIQGYEGYLMVHEAFIYIFDALLMFLTMMTLHYVHPSEVNCLLGRGTKYYEKIIKSREFAPFLNVEMLNDDASV
ncbi:RTA1-domain-containing protein [Penicillium malachiteum]|nr:RTA1-domain-containing protein [Penicillium malachiteum]